MMCRPRSSTLAPKGTFPFGQSRGAALVALAACLLVTTAPLAAPPPVELFPKGNEAPGWNKSGETRTFTAENLWEYINGEAEKYVQAGVRQTLTADYRYQGKIDGVVDIYVMSSREGAAKIFPSDAPAGSQHPKLGDFALLSRGSLVFRKGVYFVRIVAYQETPGIDKGLLELGRAIERKMSAPAK